MLKFLYALNYCTQEETMVDSQLKLYLDICEKTQGSDLHIKIGIEPTVRVMGILKIIGDEAMTEEVVNRFINSILTDIQIEELKHMHDVDGSFSVGLNRYRCNVYRDINGYAISIRRILQTLPDFKDLRLPEVLKQIAVKKNGLILIAGPTGSGKTTTLASIVNYLNKTINGHIVTIEDPIEYLHQTEKCIITQREIGRDAVSFSRALRASLRQDPDVILLGELRDNDSIATALTAAETGHLVLSTIHTTGAENAIDRIIDVFPSEQQQQIRYQLSMVLLSVMSQQLIPAIDGSRALASEVLICNSAIKNIIRCGKTHQILNAMMTSKNVGMYSMEQCLKKLYREGAISAENYEKYLPQIKDERSR